MAEKEAHAGHAGFSEHDGNAASAPERKPPAADLVAELASTKDRLLRSLAEQENTRTLARRDRDEAVRYAAAAFAADLLPSIDNLERALASVPEGKRSDPLTAGVLSGVEATRRAILDAFAKHGLRRLEPIGEPFDPQRHEASFEADDARYAPGAVTQVIQPGYQHHDRLLRPALVGVNKTTDQAADGAPHTPGGTAPSRDQVR
jgi:molecular chaperone GrpE